ncbi:MAG: ABC transporter permease [Negativicutes bacterium]|nr:ABC transporter permease [Negativicutes bacterium]MDR3592827.1 ABC transporter permease [Negativicutes bacterium]
MQIRLEKRLTPSTAMTLAVPAIAVVLALLFCAAFLALTGRHPFELYAVMLKGALGSTYGLSETAVKAIPLMLCGLGISLAFRMQLWNIGAEGQFYLGAFAATWVPLTFPNLPAIVMLPAMVILGMLAGGLWALGPAFLRVKWQVNEIITTLMLNYVGILWVNYFVYGPWRDPKGFNFPLTAEFPPAALLPTFGASRIHIGLLFALVIVVLFIVVFRNSRWGYEIKVIGASESAARYAGMDIKRNMYLVMMLSGAVCGLAGMAEVSGIAGRLQPSLSPGYGYTAIIVAWLAKLNPVAIVFVAGLFGVLQVGGYLVQTYGVPASVASMIQGAILFFVLGGEILTQYRIVFSGSEGKGEGR